MPAKPTVALNVRIPAELNTQLDQEKTRRNITLRALVIEKLERTAS